MSNEVRPPVTLWRVGLVCLAVLAAPVAQAETVHLEQHGTCFEYTNVDDFTDRTQHGLLCVGDAGNIATGDMLKFECYELDDVVSWAALANQHSRTMPEPDGKVSVRYRFDKGEVYSGEWAYVDGNVVSLEAEPLLEALLGSASQLVFEIDGELGRIDLSTASARTAAQKYLE